METMKENKSKKRIAIIATIFALLLTVGAIAGISLAKYVSSGDVTSKSATVAKWGYTITADANGLLFGTSYGSVNDGFATKVSDGGVVVSSASGTNVVAPGTKGEATVLTINGSAEVDALLSITVSENFKTIHLTDNHDIDYYPVKWKVNDTVINVDNNAVDANEFAKAIAEALNTQGVLSGDVTAVADNNVVTVELPADSSTEINNFQLKISWEWALQTLKTEGAGVTYYDAEDTLLGQIAQAGGTNGAFSSYAGSSWQIDFGLSANVEQVQQFPSQMNP